MKTLSYHLYHKGGKVGGEGGREGGREGVPACYFLGLQTLLWASQAYRSDRGKESGRKGGREGGRKGGREGGREGRT